MGGRPALRLARLAPALVHRRPCAVHLVARDGEARARFRRRADLCGRTTASTRTRRGGSRRGAVAAAAGRARVPTSARGRAAARPAARAGRACPSSRPGSPARARSRARAGPQRLAQAPKRQRGQHDAVPAAAADDVPPAAGQRPSSAAPSARRPCARRSGASCARGRRRRARARRARVVARAPVVDPGGGDVADAPAGGAKPALPVLLVAERSRPGSKPPTVRPRCGAAHVRAPHELGVAVGGTEVERRHRRRLAAARVEVRALEPRLDRAAERVVLRMPAAAPSSAPSQPGHAAASSSRKHRRSAVASRSRRCAPR